MNEEEIQRLMDIEKRVGEFCREKGLNTTSINFEIVTAEKVIEALAYRMPTNFHHWSFGRDFEKQETIYKITGAGIPYEVVWNFNTPTALLVATNPFALNVVIIAHVFGHVDFHLSNIFMKHGRSTIDIIREARGARKRFLEYEKRYGQEEVEKIIDAAIAFQMHQDPDMFSDSLPEEEIRRRRISETMAVLSNLQDSLTIITTKEERELINARILEVEDKIEYLKHHTPPEPQYDILKYLLEKSPKMDKMWVYDVVSVVREQMRALAPNMRTQLLNEGWATYWHVRILRQLKKEKLITPAEHEMAIHFHAQVSQKHLTGFNVYHIGPAFWEMIEDKWDKGKFGPDWENCRDRNVKENWDTNLMQGSQKILELRKVLSDRTAIENYFDDDFIRDEQLYIWQSGIDTETGNEVCVITENRPEVIRQILLKRFSSLGPSVAIIDGNLGGSGELLMQHFFSGFELDPKYESGALEKLYFLWGRPVHLLTYEMGKYDETTDKFVLKDVIHSFNGKDHKIISE